MSSQIGMKSEGWMEARSWSSSLWRTSYMLRKQELLFSWRDLPILGSQSAGKRLFQPGTLHIVPHLSTTRTFSTACLRLVKDLSLCCSCLSFSCSSVILSPSASLWAFPLLEAHSLFSLWVAAFFKAFVIIYLHPFSRPFLQGFLWSLLLSIFIIKTHSFIIPSLFLQHTVL